VLLLLIPVSQTEIILEQIRIKNKELSERGCAGAQSFFGVGMQKSFYFLEIKPIFSGKLITSSLMIILFYFCLQF
jgi:hypothetical protein